MTAANATIIKAPQGFDTKPTDGETYHRGKDGKWYSYQNLSLANRAFLQKKFELDKIREQLSPPKDTKKSTQRSTSSSPSAAVAAAEPSRRSSRLQRVSPHNPKGLNPEVLVEEEKRLEEAATAARASKRRKTGSGRGARSMVVTDEERKKLQDNVPDWLDSLEEYLTDVDAVSESNRRSVLRQVERMAAGIGITYHHWKKDTFFYKGTCIDLSFDFDKLYDEAVAFENEYGRDLGNGWLLRHPIAKLKKFQVYVKENGGL